MVPIERLKTLCRPDSSLDSPMRVDVDGRQYAIFSNGHALLAFSADALEGIELKEPTVPGLAKEVPGWLRRAFASGRVAPMSEVDTFVSGGKALREDCSECEGTGETFCQFCMRNGECHSCDGTGQSLRESEVVSVLGAPFNAVLIQHFYDGLEAETVRVSRVEKSNQGSDPLVIAEESGLWAALVMPLKQSEIEHATRSWPEVTQ